MRTMEAKDDKTNKTWHYSNFADRYELSVVLLFTIEILVLFFFLLFNKY